MLRIGLLMEYATLNGGERSLLAVLDRLSPHHLEVVAFAPPAGPLVDELRRRGIPHVPLSWRRPDGPKLPDDVLVSTLQRAVDDHRLDLLHANSLSMGRALGAVADRLPLPTTAHLRDIIKLSGKAVADLNRHRKLFAVSRATREFHVRQGLDPRRVFTLYNGVDCDLFRPRERTGFLRRELRLPRETFLAATIGQISLRKGQDDLAHAAALLRDRFPSLHFLLIGERYSAKPETVRFDEQITRAFQAAGISGRLHRLGFRTDVPAILNEVDLLVHPARQEPLGRVLLEAASAGTPIVATRVGGTGEILEHGTSAWLVPASHPGRLAQGIGRLLDEADLRRSLAAAARSVSLERFSIAPSAAALLNAWSDEGVDRGESRAGDR